MAVTILYPGCTQCCGGGGGPSPPPNLCGCTTPVAMPARYILTMNVAALPDVYCANCALTFGGTFVLKYRCTLGFTTYSTDEPSSCLAGSPPSKKYTLLIPCSNPSALRAGNVRLHAGFGIYYPTPPNPCGLFTNSLWVWANSSDLSCQLMASQFMLPSWGPGGGGPAGSPPLCLHFTASLVAN